MATATKTISPAQAAKVLGKSRAVVVSLIKAGELPATDEHSPRTNKARYRIDPADLTRWRESRAVLVESPQVKPPARRLNRAVGVLALEMERQAKRATAK